VNALTIGTSSGAMTVAIGRGYDVACRCDAGQVFIRVQFLWVTQTAWRAMNVKRSRSGASMQHYQSLVRNYIESGNFPDEGRLPPERELVSILGITRNQIRSAFKKFAQEGLIWRHVGKGTFVGRRPAESTPVIDAIPGADLTNPREVIETRIFIEPILARLAASRASQRDIEAMERSLEDFKNAGSPENFQRMDRNWHLQLAQAGGNGLLAGFLKSTHAHTDPNIWSRLRNLYMTTDRMAQAVEEHRAVLNAIRSRDADKAEDAMRKHIRSVRTCIFGNLE
jgi:DNA-binding FadR family transcriptional regulator